MLLAVVFLIVLAWAICASVWQEWDHWCCRNSASNGIFLMLFGLVFARPLACYSSTTSLDP